MRMRRIKVSASQQEGFYHCMTRTVNGEAFFGELEKEVLRKQLWQVADYCGVQILTYAILSNHFHVLLRVPQKEPISDEELLRRYRVLYPKPTRYRQASHAVLARMLRESPEDPIARQWRESQLALMNDVSAYMKLLKQRFSVWFNQTHGRYGTLWAERFKSVMVEGNQRVLTTMAAYIDLNAVRAGLALDPKDYRFCGYAEALAGRKAAQVGLTSLSAEPHWKTARAAYRQILFGSGAQAREQSGSISMEAFAKVMKEKGHLPLQTVLRCRLRYFTDGAVLGSRNFVQGHLNAYRKAHQLRRRTPPPLLPALTDWGELSTLRSLRKTPFG